MVICFPLCCIQASASLRAAAILSPKSSGLRFAATDRSIVLPLFSRSLFTAPSGLMWNSAALRMGGNERHCSAAQEGATKVYFLYNVSLVVPVFIGTPPQEMLMVADTGSELSWVRCLSASSQGQQSDKNSFDPFQSSSYASIPCNSSACTAQTAGFPSPTNCGEKAECHFSYTYADATASEGTLARETISLGNGLTMAGMVFGCVNSTFLTKSNSDPTPGIMGLNRGALSFISQVQANLYPKKFSYCIADPLQFPNSPGVLIFGESPYSNALSYTPLVKLPDPLPYFNNVAYSLRLEAIKVGEKLLPLAESVFMPDHTGAGQTMIDSGTQFTFLLGAAYGALKKEFAEQVQGRMHSLKERRDFSFEGVLDLCYSTLLARTPFLLSFLRSRSCSILHNWCLKDTGCCTRCPSIRAPALAEMLRKFTASRLGIRIWFPWKQTLLGITISRACGLNTIWKILGLGSRLLPVTWTEGIIINCRYLLNGRPA